VGAPVRRDTTAALGTPGEPGRWRRARDGACVALSRECFADARWSFLYGEDTSYAPHREDMAPPGPAPRVAPTVQEGPGRAPDGGAELKAPVWTWEVPLYFWLGGIAAGSSFVAVACEAAGDERSSRVARFVSVGAIVPGAPLLIKDLGRPARFLHMLRIFKPRSPMSMGVWCLLGFSNAMAGAVAADLTGHRSLSRALTGATGILGTYLGSYTGVLLASTAVPVWGRSRSFLGPIFICTGVATGAAAVGLAPVDPRTRRALAGVESAALVAELALSAINERRLGPSAEPLHSPLMRTGKALTLAALALRFSHRAGPTANLLTLAAGLAFRYAWVRAGRSVGQRQH
jgi:hypothetical protein